MGIKLIFYGRTNLTKVFITAKIKKKFEKLLKQKGYYNTIIRLAVTKESYGWSLEDIIYVEYAGTKKFVDKDVVTVCGEVYGNYTYESQAGYNISLPAVIADSIE